MKLTSVGCILLNQRFHILMNEIEMFGAFQINQINSKNWQ